MAAQNKLFQRLIWLVDTIYSAGRITREEIDRRWRYSSYNDRPGSDYGERNFFRHRDTILELFGIEIEVNRTTREYSINMLDDVQGDHVRSWLVDTFAINNMVNLAGDLKSRIIFEPIPAGSRYLSSIVSAMKEEHQLLVTYQRFDGEPHSFLLAPYCIKVFKRRWYLVGKPDDHPEETDPRVYALDRVRSLTVSDTPYKFPRKFNASEFFEGQFGVDRRNTHVEQVRVRVDANTANYLRTLPIHSSQIEFHREADHSIFLYEIAPTYDFIQELRKHGSHLEVLEPQWLRDDFAADHQKALEMYGKFV